MLFRSTARPAARPTQPAPRAPAADRQTRTAPPAPIVPYAGASLLERELAARAAGLRTQTNRSPQGTPKPAPTAPLKPFRTDPLIREPAAKSAIALFKPFRIDPLNREPTAKPGSNAPFKPFRTDPLNREPTAKPGATAPRVAARIPPAPPRPHSPPEAMTQHRAQNNRGKAARPGLHRRRPVAAPRSCVLHPIAPATPPKRLAGVR